MAAGTIRAREWDGTPEYEPARESETLESLRGTIEHFVPKTKGGAFVELLTQHADDLCVEEHPKCGKCPLLDECPTVSHFRLLFLPAPTRVSPTVFGGQRLTDETSAEAGS